MIVTNEEGHYWMSSEDCIKKAQGGQSHMYTKAVRVKEGEVITIAREQATRWVQHYTEVLTDQSLMSLLTQIVKIISTLTLTCPIRLKWRLQQRQ